MFLVYVLISVISGRYIFPTDLTDEHGFCGSPKIAIHLFRKFSKIISLLSLVATNKFLVIFGLIFYNFCY